MHVHADRDGGVAASKAARCDDQIVRGGDAEPAQLDGDGRCEVAGGFERVDRLERVAAVAVVLGRTGGELAESSSAIATRRAPVVVTAVSSIGMGEYSNPLVMHPRPEYDAPATGRGR